MGAVYVVFYLAIAAALYLGYSDFFTEDFLCTGFDRLAEPRARARAAGSKS
jgi:hypothetical protein